MAGAVRVNVSIPGDVRARMLASEQAGLEFNWSRIATAAIVAAIDARVRDGAGGGTADRIKTIVSRLVATGTVDAEEEAAVGAQDGRRWAEADATPAELDRIRALSGSPTWRTFFGSTMPSSDHRLVHVIDATPPDAVRVAGFWASVRALDPDRPHHRVARSDRYVKSFTREAVAVWEQVLPHYAAEKLRRGGS